MQRLVNFILIFLLLSTSFLNCLKNLKTTENEHKVKKSNVSTKYFGIYSGYPNKYSISNSLSSPEITNIDTNNHK